MTTPASNVAPGEMVRDHLIEAKKIPAEMRRRLAPDVFESVPKTEVAEYEQDGWVVDSELKTKTKMRKAKQHDVAFEDRVWAAFARLQFNHLNRARSFRLQYGGERNESQQIDVFAADDEVVLVVECKSTATIQAGQFKKEVEAISGQRGGVIKRLKTEYPQHKIKFILATSNYTVSDAVTERIRSADVFHVDEDAVEYFLTLAEHLGAAAKYQLLGALFAGQKIPNLEPTLPAIRGSMGGHTYYSFAIEPARLLKMAYVLHRNQANSELMPTYQRLIKKSRLKKVAAFVEDGGFFPNSIILNVETRKQQGELQFDLAGKDSKAPGAATIGLVHLPQTYRAAYVIDGQHRLYGYANSARAQTDLIPVVAFVDLPRSEQVRLFMQINENQQAVPKNLRNTLNADLLWESDDHRERVRALRLSIAQHLGEQKGSPLYDRVIIGENQRTNLRCVTIDAISNGLNRGNFIGTFVKTGAKSQGTFFAGDNKATAKVLTPFLESAFAYIRDGLESQWRIGGADGGFVFMNNGVEALLRLLSDIVDHVKQHEDVKPLNTSTDDVVKACEPFLDSLIDHIEGLNPDAGSEYRKLYGTGGVASYYRRLQLAVRDARPEFNPAGLDDWVKAQDKEFVSEATSIVQDVEDFFKKDIRSRLEDEFGSDWWHKGVPRAVRKSTSETAIAQNLDRPANEQLEPWDCMYLVNYHDVLAGSHDVWQRRFEKHYTKPGDEQLSGTWKNKLTWIKDLNEIRNNVSHARGITDENYAFLTELKSWLLLGEIDNDL
jgi:DNA sulfur modification protein DndB